MPNSTIKGLSPAIRRRRMRLKLLMAGGALLALALALVLYAFQDSIVFFHGPSDIAAGKVEANRNFRLGGLVESGTLSLSDANGITKFWIEDGVHRVEVRFQGILPDLFREGQGVVALGHMKEGYMTGGGYFQAEEVLAKHDENYMPAEAVEAMKKAGTWKGEE